LIQNSITATNTTTSAMLNPAAPRLRALAMATTSARMHQAETSFIAAQISAVTLRGDFVSPRSSRIRASTGNAVMLNETPMNSAKAGNVVAGPANVGKR